MIFFDNSTVRTAGLEAIQTLISESGKLLAPCATRWLSTERSVNGLRKCYISVVLGLQREGEERSDAKALGLNKLVTEYRFVVQCFYFVMLFPMLLIYPNVFRVQTVIIVSYLEWYQAQCMAKNSGWGQHARTRSIFGTNKKFRN